MNSPMVTFLLFASLGCTSSQPKDTAAVEGAPFDEVTAQGLTDYLGTASPTSVTEGEDFTTHNFDPEDGPMCFRGAPFSVSTRPGEGDELIVFLQGGGACWSGLCNAFEDVLGFVPEVGILNRGLESNPVAGWNVGYVPYCDGSLFTGDAEIDDDGDGVIDRHHRGLQNLSAALDVFREEFPDPSRIMVVGSSAGAYGTTVAAMLVRTVFPDVRIDVVADAGIGLGKPNQNTFIRGVLEEWRIMRLLPESCTDCLAGGHVTGMIDWVLERDPNMHAYAITSYEDLVIGTLFLQLTGPVYKMEVLSATEALEASHPDRYHRYLFEGSRHTTVSIDTSVDLAAEESIPFDVDPQLLVDILGTFDGTNIGGVTVATWLGDGLADAPGFSSLMD